MFCSSDALFLARQGRWRGRGSAQKGWREATHLRIVFQPPWQRRPWQGHMKSVIAIWLTGHNGCERIGWRDEGCSVQVVAGELWRAIELKTVARGKCGHLWVVRVGVVGCYLLHCCMVLSWKRRSERVWDGRTEQAHGGGCNGRIGWVLVLEMSYFV